MKILCGGAQCGEPLGEVGPATSSLMAGPVWYVRPGWRWAFPPGIRGQPLGRAILEFAGEPRAELQLTHEVYGITRIADSRVGVAREAKLPIVVRCPHCHRLRYVPPEVFLRAVIPA